MAELDLELTVEAVEAVDDHLAEQPTLENRSEAFRDLAERATNTVTKELVEIGRVTLADLRDVMTENTADGLTAGVASALGIDPDDVHSVTFEENGETVMARRMSTVVAAASGDTVAVVTGLRDCEPPVTTLALDPPPGMFGLDSPSAFDLVWSETPTKRVILTVPGGLVELMDDQLERWRRDEPDAPHRRLTRRTVAENIIRQALDMGWPAVTVERGV